MGDFADGYNSCTPSRTNIDQQTNPDLLARTIILIVSLTLSPAAFASPPSSDTASEVNAEPVEDEHDRQTAPLDDVISPGPDSVATASVEPRRDSLATKPDASTGAAPAAPAVKNQLLAEDEILWLARCIYSESDRPDEQRLVAWVVRNRVETQFRGDTYREVVLESKQFSAFNDPTPRRQHILSLTASTPLPSWQKALEIARQTYEAPSSERPFSITTRHFYSPISMKGRAVPEWAVSHTPITVAGVTVDDRRFRFFDEVDNDAAGQEEEATLADRRREVKERIRSRLPRRSLTTGANSSVRRPARPVPPARSQPSALDR